LKTLTFFINALNVKPVCIIGQNGADFHSGAPKLAPDFQNCHLKMAPGDFSGSYFLGARTAPASFCYFRCLEVLDLQK
jgi:hypothetical protein